jgi:hypothetical protein
VEGKQTEAEGGQREEGSQEKGALIDTALQPGCSSCRDVTCVWRKSQEGQMRMEREMRREKKDVNLIFPMILGSISC